MDTYNPITINPGDFVAISDGNAGIYNGFPINIELQTRGITKIYYEGQTFVGDKIYYNSALKNYSNISGDFYVGSVIKKEFEILTIDTRVEAIV